MKPEGHTETMCNCIACSKERKIAALQQANERMREALKSVVDQFKGSIETRNDQDAIDEARAALAEARGEEQ